ncbi:TPA: DUF1330 domain-containing protein [Pseudomonas aeruginosa]|nr:DUF1330 domain-containing protein [Pseudomonas aeruginosa]
MAAYLIFIRDRITDSNEFAHYQREAIQTTQGHPVTPLVLYGTLETLEGPRADGVVVMHFPDLEAARAWYHSPEYQRVLQHRLKGAEYRVTLVEGIDIEDHVKADQPRS